MAKKSKAKTTKKPATRPAAKVVKAPARKAAATTKAAPAAAKPATKTAAKAPVKAAAAKKATAARTAAPKATAAARKPAKAARPALTPSTPAAPARSAMAAKAATPTPAVTKPAPVGSGRPTPSPADSGFDGPITGIDLSVDELRKVKSGLSKKDLEHYRAVLLEKRAEIMGDVEGMERHRTAGGGEMSHMPLHPADVGSEHYEQEFNLGLMQSEKRLLREIDDALLRIQDGTYGVCFESGRPIPRARLEIKPWAKYTIEVVMEREKRGLQ